MITLIGTGHVFNLTEPLLATLEAKHPDVVCVELDRQRFEALLQRQSSRPTVPDKNLPFVYRLLAQFQDSMAQQYGVQAGGEMLTAVTYARSRQLPVEFIDTDGQKLFIAMWRSMPMGEKLRLLFSGVSGLFISRRRVEHELAKYEQDFDSYLVEIGKRFPTIKKTLIDDRNKAMAGALVRLSGTYERIVACVGDGHIPGISSELQAQNIAFETVRLRELQQAKPQADGSAAHFTTEYRGPSMS